VQPDVTEASPRDPRSAALALRMHFLLSALRLELLPPALARLVGKLAAKGEARETGLAPLVSHVRDAFLDAERTLGLEGVGWPVAPADRVGRAVRAALESWGEEGSPRDHGDRLGRFCEALLRGRRKTTGSYYTPPWLADEIAETAIRGVLAGRGAATSQALALRVLDPAIGAGAFALAAVEATAAAAGEGRSENAARRAAARDCLFGCERRRLAADACRLALWLSASRPGRPAAIPADRIVVAEALSHRPEARSFDVILGNPPWGVTLPASQASRLAAAAPEALSGHRDSFLFFLHLAAEAARDDGAIGLLLPDTILSQVRYEGIRRLLLERFRPLRVTLLGDGIFPGATAPACLLCLSGRALAPRHFPTSDLRRVSRDQLEGEMSRAGSPTPCDAPLSAAHSSFLAPPAWLRRLLRRLTAAMPALGDPALGFEFHDVGINYPRAEIGRAALYAGKREHPDDRPVTRGRDFGPFTSVGHSAWLRHDWRRRTGPAGRVSVRECIYRVVPKLLFRQTADRPIATLDRRGVWFGRSVIALTGPGERQLLRLVAISNSRAFAALYRAVAPEVGRAFAQVKVSKLKLLPVPPAGRDGLAELAAKLLDEADKARRATLVRQLDLAVYRAYRLTAAEIARIEREVPPCLPASADAPSARARRLRRAATS